MSNNQPNNQPVTRVVTGQVRLSYVHLFTPRTGPNGGEPKFSTTFLIPKSDVATKQRIDAAVQAAIQHSTSTKWGGVRPPQVGIPVYDGDGVRPSDGMPFGDECKGNWVITASTKQAPQIIDMNLNPIINQTEIYSGIYGRVALNFFGYFNSGKKGIGCGLNAVQKTADGEPLAGRTDAAALFGGGEPMAAYAPQTQTFGGVPGQPPYQQPQYQPPQQPQYQPPQQPQYQPPQQPPQQPPLQPQIDPITGQPITGGVMGI